MDEFICAFGRCTVGDGVLIIRRSTPETMSRWEIISKGVATSWEYQPRRTILWLGRTALLGVIFIGLVGYLYTAFTVDPSLVVGLGILGILALVGPLELTYRRVMRERDRIQQMVAAETTVAYPEQITLDDITSVSVQAVSTGAFVTDGHLLLVEFHRSENIQTTYLGFPKFMNEELETALTLFEQRGIAITETQC